MHLPDTIDPHFLVDQHNKLMRLEYNFLRAFDQNSEENFGSSLLDLHTANTTYAQTLLEMQKNELLLTVDKAVENFKQDMNDPIEEARVDELYAELRKGSYLPSSLLFSQQLF
jgi:hypothetical protein